MRTTFLVALLFAVVVVVASAHPQSVCSGVAPVVTSCSHGPHVWELTFAHSVWPYALDGYVESRIIHGGGERVLSCTNALPNTEPTCSVSGLPPLQGDAFHQACLAEGAGYWHCILVHDDDLGDRLGVDRP